MYKIDECEIFSENTALTPTLAWNSLSLTLGQQAILIVEPCRVMTTGT